MECTKNLSTFYASVYVTSLLPLLFMGLIWVVYLARLAGAVAMGADQRVGDDQRAHCVEIEAQGTPARAHHHFALGSVGTHTEDGAAIDSDIQPTLPRHDMLGAVLGSQRQGLQRYI